VANLRDVRLRIRAIRQTLQVTKAMNLISTAKLRKGRRIKEDTEPYFIRIQKSMFDILSGAGRVHSPFFRAPRPGGPSRAAVIAVTSDKGLAGGYNANIFRKVNELCGELSNPVLILIGAIGYRYFVHSPHLILENFSFKSVLPTVENAKEVADFVISRFLPGMLDEVHIVYTHMYSTIKLVPRELQILPLNAEKMQEDLSRQEQERRVELHFEFLPSKEAVFDALAPLYIKGIIYGVLIEAYAAEQSARMTAMDEASKNAEEMLSVLQVHYNRARQAGITQEMSEIVGGAAALSK
jgi:F-type H+-transporting ATPase subunit gamma